VKERQDSIAARIAGTIAGGVRRRQQERESRAIVYDRAGEPSIVPPGSDAQGELIELADSLMAIALEGEDGSGAEEGDAAPGEPDAG